MSTTLRVHFFGGGRDPLSRLMQLGGRITGRTGHWTHVGVSFPDYGGGSIVGELFHLTLGGTEWTDLFEQLEWAMRHESIDVELDPITYYEVFNRIYGLEKGGAATTITGLTDLFFRAERYSISSLVCTDLVDVLMATETRRSLTPDELYGLLKHGT